MKDDETPSLWIHFATSLFDPHEFCELIFKEDGLLLLYYRVPSSITRMPARERGVRRTSRILREILMEKEMFVRALRISGDVESARRFSDREIELSYEEINEISMKEGRRILLLNLKPKIEVRSGKKTYSYRIQDEGFDSGEAQRELERLSERKGFKFRVQ